MVHENGKKRAGHCGSFMIRMNNSNAFSRSSASWTNWSFYAPMHSKITQEMTSLIHWFNDNGDRQKETSRVLSL